MPSHRADLIELVHMLQVLGQGVDGRRKARNISEPLAYSVLGLYGEMRMGGISVWSPQEQTGRVGFCGPQSMSSGLGGLSLSEAHCLV